MTRYSDAGSVRRDLGSRLGKEVITDPLWSFFDKGGDVAKVVDGEKDLGWLVDRVIEFCDASGRPIERRMRSEMLSSNEVHQRVDFQRLLSRLAAEDARGEPGVRSFRKEVLNDRLIAPEDIEEWIKRQEKLDGPGTHWIEIPLRPPHRLELDQKTGTFSVRPELKLSVLTESSIRLRTLDYAALPDRWVRRVPTAAGGVLERLRLLTESLLNKYDWEHAAATIFVLSGLIPFINTIALRSSWSTSNFKRRSVELSVDPAVSPAELAKLYRAYRQKIMSGRRLRRLSDKHLRLAAFLADRPDESWEKRFRSWNKSHPKWKYSQESNFRRDALKARERFVVNPLGVAN